ncbi:hypothetical protein V8E52_012018 [Russula decolorans]
MVKFHDFLVEHAKFPFPLPDELQTCDSTDVSNFEVGLLEREWKAKYAVRDDALVRKLCDGLKNILGDTALSADSETDLLATFSRSESNKYGEDEDWLSNPGEAQSRLLLHMGVYQAARRCLFVLYGRHRFKTDKENSVEGGSSKVDFVLLVNDNKLALCEAKSPSVMHKVGRLLPERGIELTWFRGQSLIPKFFANAALYLGLRRMEWLFVTCHNYWIVCRLVRDDDRPFLAYSPKISIQDSSEPFRAFLGAILSVLNGAYIEPSIFNPDIQLNSTIIEDTDEGHLPEDDIEEHSGAYPGRPSKGSGTESPMTRYRARAAHDNAKLRLMITSSSPNSPESFQVWVHLQALSNNTLALPVPDRNGQRRLWLTRFIGHGSTGRVWQSHFDNSGDSFAVKIVELLYPSDTDSQQRLRNEFSVYLNIEAAYQSKRLRDRITPRCYGAFESDGVDVLVLDLCDGILHTWDELSASELVQVYKLVKDLHSIGIVHRDLEPRNVTRAPGGGFYLIDFSQSRKHICKENMVGHSRIRGFAPIQNEEICYELQTLRNSLWNRNGIPIP